MNHRNQVSSSSSYDDLRHLVETHPLLAIDEILAVFPGVSGVDAKSYLRSLLCEAVLKATGYIASLKPEEDIFNSHFAEQRKDFIAMCLLRFIACSEDWASDAPGFKSGTFKLFDTCFARSLYGHLKLDAKRQSYEKEERLRDYVVRTERLLLDFPAELDGLATDTAETIASAIHELKKALGKTRILIAHFVDRDMIAGKRVDELCAIVQDYFQADDRNILHSYERAKSALERFLLQAQAYGTQYSRQFLGAIALSLLKRCIARFEKSSISAAATMSLRATEKRYAFHVEGRTLNLAFIFINEGPGYAFDVSCRITHIDDTAEVLRSEMFLGEVAPRPITVEFTIRMKRPTHKLIVEVECEWKNFDHTPQTKSEIVELDGQPSGVDWESLAVQDPYKLDPVCSEEEFVGRREQLNQLIAHANATAVGSACIYGQKRVGKTSIANAFKTRILKDGKTRFLVIYAQPGDYVHPEPRRTVEQLGVRVCRLLKTADSRLASVPVPEFDGALTPLVDFLDTAIAVIPNVRIIFMLDEFDQVPVDIFRRGLLGDAFFATIRSISHMPNVGFVLIGGERMQFVFDCQGEALNKFQMIRVDYFDKERHWSDFCDLVCAPVSSWQISFSPEALVLLHSEAAGNPFFTNLICRSLFKLMVGRRDCSVTSQEVEQAIEMALQNCSTVQFCHFWEDGILETDRKEQISMLRREVLLSMAEALKRSGSATKAQIVGESARFGMDQLTVEHQLQEFVHRQVLLESGGFFQCKIPFFSRWLKQVGFREISTTFTDVAAIEARRREEETSRVSAQEIVSLCSSLPHYKGRRTGSEEVRAWLDQFGSNTDQRLMFTLLRHLKMYSEDELRGKLREAHGIVSRGLVDRRAHRQMKRSDVLVSYLDGPGKSGAHLARLYIDENDIYKENMIELGTLDQALSRENIQVVVFVDDFVGTGDSALGYLAKLSEQVRRSISSNNRRMFFIAIAGFEAAVDRIARKAEELQLDIGVHVCDSLNESHHCFSQLSPVFSCDTDRNNARDIAYRKGVALCKQAPLGYGDCQALVVFSHNCPNNTLPVIWDKAQQWTPLFRRD